MKLLTLKLENFQGIKAAEFALNGQSASIWGDNATGKTTVFNALCWLLFDKASTGAKNFTPKTNSADGHLHYLDHAAEADFRLGDGRIITLRKVYHENYTKKRGSATEEFAGHGVDFFIDGVPVREKDYEATLFSFCGGNPETMKLLILPHYFAEEMSWDSRRRILLELCGDIADADIIRSRPELRTLPDILRVAATSDRYYSVDDYKKTATAQKIQINKELQGLPGRIDEAERAIPEFKGLGVSAPAPKIQELTRQKEVAERARAQAQDGDLSATALRNQIAEANAELAEARAAHAARHSADNEAIYTTLHTLKHEENLAKNQLQDDQAELERAQKTLAGLQTLREQLVDEYKTAYHETWDESQETCPTCRQALPEVDRQTLRDDFERRKSQRLQEINAKGQREAGKERFAELDAGIAGLENAITAATVTLAEIASQISAQQNRLQRSGPFENSPQFASLSAKIAGLKLEEANYNQHDQAVLDQHSAEIHTLSEAIREQEHLLLQLALAEAQHRRIAELQAREKELTRHYELLEQGISLCELFIKTKVSLLTERINSKFQRVRFRLFVEQLNGGVKEDCEVMVPDADGRRVPFAFANHAARINAGLEIINALAAHWQTVLPVFVDNAESVTRLLPMPTQVIRLIVSEPDKTLRLELDADSPQPIPDIVLETQGALPQTIPDIALETHGALPIGMDF